MSKFFRWLWFLLGLVGVAVLSVHCWQRLSHLEAVTIIGILFGWMLRWFSEVLVYQWDIPKVVRW